MVAYHGRLARRLPRRFSEDSAYLKKIAERRKKIFRHTRTRTHTHTHTVTHTRPGRPGRRPGRLPGRRAGRRAGHRPWAAMSFARGGGWMIMDDIIITDDNG